jgi:lipopolysaccharide transport system permease protein
MRIHVFAFLILFRRRLCGSSGLLRYAVFVVAGLAPWMALQNVLGRGPTAILSNANLVKQIVFRNEVLPLRVALGALSALVIGIAVVGMLAPIGGLGGSSTVSLLIVAAACYPVMTAGLVDISGRNLVFRQLRQQPTQHQRVGLQLPGTHHCGSWEGGASGPHTYATRSRTASRRAELSCLRRARILLPLDVGLQADSARLLRAWDLPWGAACAGGASCGTAGAIVQLLTGPDLS